MVYIYFIYKGKPYIKYVGGRSQKNTNNSSNNSNNYSTCHNLCE